MKKAKVVKATSKKTAPNKKKAASALPKVKKVVVAKRVPAKKARAAKDSRANSPCRMILIDVENTSSEERLASVLDHLKIDHKLQRTEVAAIGNWKAVGSRSGRLLARAGAHLMHSAPATGVRDWSDLWIAVAAGRWIAHASPGDRLDIVSDDHAFDAVADAAAACGVEFHRVSYRNVMGVPEEAVVREVTPSRRRRGGRRRKPAPGGGTSNAETPPRPPYVAVPAAPKVVLHADGDGAAAATPDNIREAIRRLTGDNSERWVNLDLVGSELRAQGFIRPPGSPRLVTRVRLLQDVEVSPTGMARIKPGSSSAAVAAEPSPETAAAPAKAARARRPPRKRTATPQPEA